MSIAALGSKDIVMVFKALGVETFFATEPDEIKDMINELDKKEYKIILMPQTQAQSVEAFLKRFDDKPWPIILSIPDGLGGENLGISKIIRNMERAIGSAASLR